MLANIRYSGRVHITVQPTPAHHGRSRTGLLGTAAGTRRACRRFLPCCPGVIRAAPPCNRDLSGVKGSGECGRRSGGRRGEGGAERRGYTARGQRTEPTVRARTRNTAISGCAQLFPLNIRRIYNRIAGVIQIIQMFSISGLYK